MHWWQRGDMEGIVLDLSDTHFEIDDNRGGAHAAASPSTMGTPPASAVAYNEQQKKAQQMEPILTLLFEPSDQGLFWKVSPAGL